MDEYGGYSAEDVDIKCLNEQLADIPKLGIIRPKQFGRDVMAMKKVTLEASLESPSIRK